MTTVASMPKECCGNCKFYIRAEVEDSPGGYCRRLPPLPMIVGMRPPVRVMTPQGPMTGEPQPMVGSYHPPVRPDLGWCGEWTVIPGVPHPTKAS